MKSFTSLLILIAAFALILSASFVAAQEPVEPEYTFGYIILGVGDKKAWKECHQNGCEPDETVLNAYNARCIVNSGDEIILNKKPQDIKSLDDAMSATSVLHFYQTKEQKDDEFCNIENAQAGFTPSFVKIKKFVTGLHFEPEKCIDNTSLICTQNMDGTRPDQECAACSNSATMIQCIGALMVVLVVALFF